MADLILKPSSGSGNKVRIQDQTGADNLVIDADASMTGVKPHIIPGMLYPSYVATGTSNKLLDGSTSHSGAFGTEQSDGRKYYYTNIAGSKPIHAPIGAHFGSQRHKFKSLQLLEQETATHGENVYSIDGREWMRAVDSGTNGWHIVNHAHGNEISSDKSDHCVGNFIEITGYFNDFNLISLIGQNHCDDIDVTVNGTLNVDGHTTLGGDVSAGQTVLQNRLVDAGSVINAGVSTSLGLNTMKIECKTGTSEYLYLFAIDLIAQDLQDFTATNGTNKLHTTGHTLTNGDQITLAGSDLPNGLNATTTYYVIGVDGNDFQVATSSGGSAVTFSDDGSGTRTWRALNNVVIPAQTVVSYGKKFNIDAQSTHYDPFHGFTNDTTLFASRVDVATSLGLGTATTWGAAWDKGSSNHIRPYNGGRVVKWIDASGNVKTSVTMMPANAQNVKETASNEISTPSATNTTTTPNMSDDAVEHSLSEVAKTFYWREFGNGNANGGATGTYKDASMVDSSARDIAYVMDDGLTSLSANDVQQTVSTTINQLNPIADGDYSFITFIGTGVTFSTQTWGAGKHTFAQNLPYGTHVIQLYRDADADPDITIDGVTLSDVNIDTYGVWEEVTFHQPKMPPVPPEACIIMDTMLMADYVSLGASNDVDKRSAVSKGVRRLSCSRDVHYDYSGDNAHNLNLSPDQVSGFKVISSDSSCEGNISFFGDKVVWYGSDPVTRLNDSNCTFSSGTKGTTVNISSNNDYDGAREFSITDGPRATTFKGNTYLASNAYGNKFHLDALDLATPIHTSSHYQEFEDPILKTLVGGDRNMEQTNLVVTPDGKTWDEVTRDTSYIGSSSGFSVSADAYGSGAPHTAYYIFNEYRGQGGRGPLAFYNKDFAIAYDRMICLKEGLYTINWMASSLLNDHPLSTILKINGTSVMSGKDDNESTERSQVHASLINHLKRGDYLQIYIDQSGSNNIAGDDVFWTRFQVSRIN